VVVVIKKATVGVERHGFWTDHLQTRRPGRLCRDEFVETRSTAADRPDATVSSISTVDYRQAMRAWRVSRYFTRGGIYRCRALIVAS
jgi:hypothetical protein